MLSDEDKKSGKYSKERITILLCCSATGIKLEPLIIGKSAKPRCLKNVNVSNLGVMYDHNSKAWMTRKIFQEWATKINKKMQENDRNILLIMDNCSAHPKDLNLSHVRFLFLPKNTTSVSQPLDQGIIHSFKSSYRSFILKEMIIHEETTRSQFLKNLNLYKVFCFVSEAWKELKKETIINCFKKSGAIKDETVQMHLFESCERESVSSETSEFPVCEELSSEFDNENWEMKEESLSSLCSGDESSVKVLSNAEALEAINNLDVWLCNKHPNKRYLLDSLKGLIMEEHKNNSRKITDWLLRKDK